MSFENAALPVSALVGAEEVLQRISADERAADLARLAVNEVGLPDVAADAHVAQLLGTGEHVVAVRQAVRITPEPAITAAPDLTGRLYLTTRGLLLVGRHPLAIALGDIEELSIAGERLLVSTTAGAGFCLEVDRPRELRVLIASALAAIRA